MRSKYAFVKQIKLYMKYNPKLYGFFIGLKKSNKPHLTMTDEMQVLPQFLHHALRFNAFDIHD